MPSIDTVNDLTPRVQYVALAAQDEFDYTFPIFSDADLVVYVDNTEQALDTDYTVAGEGDDTGGTITFTTPLEGGEIVTIYRDIPIARDTDIAQNGPWSSRTYNDEQDKVFLILQQLKASLDRSLRLSIVSEVDGDDLELDAASFANMYLSFDENGVPVPAALSSQTMTQAIIGQLLYPRSAAEISAGVTPVKYAYPELDLNRYYSGDADAAFESAIAVAAQYDTGAEVTFDFDVTVTNVLLLDKVSIRGVGNPVMTLASSANSDLIINATGTLGTAIDLSANASQGALQVTVASATGLAEGDWVLLREDTYTDSTNGRKQEINRIIDITGGTITLSNNLLEAFTTAASAQIIKLNPVSGFKLRDFTALVAADQGSIFGFTYCADWLITGVTMIGAYSPACIKTTTSAYGKIIGNTFRDTRGAVAGNSLGHGVWTTAASHDIIVSNNSFENINQNAFDERSKSCQFIGNICKNCVSVAINTHGRFVQNCLIADNLIDGSDAPGISVGYSTHVAGDSGITVRGNKIRNCATHGISVAAGSGTENTGIVVENNDIAAIGINDGGSSTAGIFVGYSDDSEIKNNRIDCTSIGDDPAAGININNSDRCTISGNRIANLTSGYGINVSTCADYEITANRIRNVSSNNIITASSTGTNRVRDNKADDTTVSIETSVQTGGNSWDVGRKILSGTKSSYNPGLFGDGAGTTTTITVTGAALGDPVEWAASVDYQGVLVTAWVSVADTVSVRIQNETGGNVTIGSHNLTVYVKKYT